MVRRFLLTLLTVILATTAMAQERKITGTISDKDTKAAEFIRHFEESRHLVENDENTFRVFKVAMLLLAVMSSTRGVYGGVRSQGGISATVECLKSCLAA